MTLLKFRTELTPQSQTSQIDHDSVIAMFGSCFSEHIGARLDYFKFGVKCNPFGILFHPLAVEKAVSACLEAKKYKTSDLIEHQGLWISLDHHGSFNHFDRDKVLQRINQEIADASVTVKKASHVILTLGTAWAYRWKDGGQLVANCHKIPQHRFDKELLATADMEQSLGRIIERIHESNPEANIIWTLSPVRHLRDGFVENSRSKSRLLEAIHGVVDNNRSFYFPSYELMMDDLRDYRFYDSDLVHPNATAIDYIWEKFSATWISPTASQVMQEVDSIQKALDHKPFHPTSQAHQEFLVKTRKKIESLEERYPSIKFKKKGSAS